MEKKRCKLPPPASVNSFELPSARSVEMEIRTLSGQVRILLDLLQVCRLSESNHCSQRTISLTEDT